MLHFLLGTAGSGKTNTVRTRIAKEVINGKNGLILLTPEQYTFESERALLKLLGATAADSVEVLSFTKLIEYIEPDGNEISRPKADLGIKAVVLKKALLSVKDRLTAYANSKPSPEFILSLMEIITELKQSSIDVSELKAAGIAQENKTFSNKIQDLALIFSAYNSILNERYIDPDDDLEKLSKTLSSNNYFVGKTVYIDAFDGFTAEQYKIIEHIIRDCTDVYASFCTDSMKDNEMGTGLFSNVKKEIARFVSIANKNEVAIAAPEIFDEHPRFVNDGVKAVESIIRGEDELFEVNDGSVTVCCAETPYDEVDFTARTIKRLVRENGYRFRDFTVIVRDMDNYRRLFDSTFNRYSIPCYLDKRVDNIDFMLTSYIDFVLKTAVHGFSQDYVFSMLKSPLSFMKIDDVSELENFAFIWNIKAHDWGNCWQYNPDGMDAEMNSEKLESINALRRATVEFIEPIKKAVKDGNTKSICTAIYKFMIESLVPEKIKAFAEKLKGEGDSYLAELQYKSWDFIVDLLDKIVIVSGDYIAPSELIDTYELLLKCDTIGTIPSRIDEVMIGDAYRIRPCEPKIVFILGANYREMPKPPTNNGILSINDRARLIKSGIEINDRVETDSIKERYVTYSSVCCASERVFITYHNYDKSYQQTVASDFVRLIESHIKDFRIISEIETRSDRFESVGSLFEFVADNYDSIEVDFDRINAPELKSLNDSVDSMKNGIGGTLTAVTAKKLRGGDLMLSPSRLELFSKCPFSYFCRYDIKARTIEKAQITPSQRGSLAHHVLENILKKYVKTISDLSDEQLKNEIEIYANEYVQLHFNGFNIDDKRFVFTVERIKNLLFDVIKNIAAELAQSQFEPIAFEQSISPSGEIKPIKIPVNDGNLMIIGTIDRVDIYKSADKAYVRVVDYKTGEKNFALSDILYGLNMQMLLYLYSYIEGKTNNQLNAGGVLYMPVRYADYIDSNDKIDNSKYTMNGLINREDKVPEAMEKLAEGKYVPYKYKKDGDYTSASLYSSDDFSDIRSKVVSVVKSVGEQMKDGDISRRPLYIKSSCACDYCDYKSVCLSANENVRIAEKQKNVMDAIRSEVNDNEADQ